MTYDANMLRYVMIETLDTPEEAFKMVMEYAVKSNKNKWICFGEVFNPYNHTVILLDEDGNYVGYGSGHVIANEPESFFLNHGFLRNGVINKDKIIDNIADTVSKKIGYVIKKVKMTSDLDARMWKWWGFELDKMVAYEKEVK